MQEHPKSQKQSHQSIEISTPNLQLRCPEKQSCQICEHLLNQNQIAQIREKARSAVVGSGRLKWEQQFREDMDVQILETNFQWMRVMLHYGNYRLDVMVIYTDVDERIFQEGDSKRGAFGVVRFLIFQGAKYAVKGIKFSYKDGQIDTLAVYKEYFLSCIADTLGVGPKILPLFGYDILLTKNMAFFCMEECQPIKFQSPQVVKSELLRNLKFMHSIQFVHNDIKPENMGFSEHLQKHIFLDFGLSKLICESPGEKTKTKFLGTLSYCSDQMKKCYLFQMAKYVDLYANDICCLNKATQEFQYLLKMHSFFKGRHLKKENMCQMDTLTEMIQVLRLKYFIQAESVKQVEKNLLAMANKKNKKIIYQIFSSQQIPYRISRNERIRQRLSLVREEVFSGKFQIDKLDSMLCEIFCQEKRIISAEKIIPVSQILSSKPELFDHYLVKPDLLLKILHFFDPFTTSLKKIENKYEIKRAIIERIYQTKNTEIMGPVFFCEKTRFALVYFYEKLKSLKNLKAMLSLRLMFVLVQQWSFVKKLQDQIVQMIENPLLKILKRVQFTLFRFSFQRYEGLILEDPAKEMKCQSNQLDLPQSKAKKLLQAIKSPRFKSISQELDSQKVQMLSIINMLKQKCVNFYQKQSIYNINFLFIKICQSYSSTFSQKIPKQLMLDTFYSFKWSFKTVQFDCSKHLQQRLFWPLQIEYQYHRQNIQKQKSSNQLEVLVENQLILLKNRSLPLSHQVQYIQVFNPTKKILYYWLGKFQKVFKSQSSVTKEQIIFCLYCMSEYLELVLIYQHQSKEDNKIGKQQKAIMFNDLGKAFIKFIERQQIRQIVEKSEQIKINVAIARVKFEHEKGKTAEELRPQIQALVHMHVLQPLPDHTFRLSAAFINIFHYIIRLICHSSGSYLKDILVYITEQYITRKHFYLFQGLIYIPQEYIKINNQTGREGRNLEIILQLVGYYKNKNDEIYSCTLPVKLYCSLVDVFCTTLRVERLHRVYLQLRFNQRQYSCGCYAYLIFLIFLKTKAQITEPDQLRQVIRTTLCLGSMPSMCLVKSKQEIVKLYRQLLVPKSKRKAFTCIRLEIRNTVDDRRITIFRNKLENRVDKIGNYPNDQQVRQGLNKKIRRFKKI